MQTWSKRPTKVQIELESGIVDDIRGAALSIWETVYLLAIVYQEQFYKLNRGCLLYGLKATWEFDVPTKWLQVKEKGAFALLRAESEEEAGDEGRKWQGGKLQSVEVPDRLH